MSAGYDGRGRMGRLPIAGTFALAVRLLLRAPGRIVLVLLGQFVVTVVATFVTQRLLKSLAPHLVAQIVDALLQEIVAAFATGAIVVIALAAAEQRVCGLGEAFRQSTRRFGPMALLFVLQAVIVGVAMLLLIVPGLVAAILLSVAVPACMIEGSSPLASLSRSTALTRGNRWRIAALFGIVVLMAAAALGALLPIIWHADPITIVAFVAGVLVFVALFLISTTMSTALYLNLRTLEP